MSRSSRSGSRDRIYKRKIRQFRHQGIAAHFVLLVQLSPQAHVLRRQLIGRTVGLGRLVHNRQLQVIRLLLPNCAAPTRCLSSVCLFPHICCAAADVIFTRKKTR